MNKYNNKITYIDNIKFHSKLEASHYQQLKKLQKQGQIKELELQPSYKIIINNIKICKVILDFKFYDNEKDKYRYVDSKGVYTAISRLKHKLLQASHDIKVEIWKGQYITF
jgi:hypothetical protein